MIFENLQGCELLEKHESNVAFIANMFSRGGEIARDESKPILDVKAEVLRRLKIYDQIQAGELKFSWAEDGTVVWGI